MSDLLGHWAVFDDCRRVAAIDPGVAPFVNRILVAHELEARLGAISRGGGWWVYQLMPELRKQADVLEDLDNPAGDAARRRLAYALGGIIHYPADHFVKPLLKRMTADGTSKRVVSAYYDIEVFREVYLSGAEEPFHAFLLAHNPTEPGQALEKFIAALFQRALLSSHTLAPPREYFEDWLDTLLAKVQPLYVDVNLYCRLWASPDPAMVERLEVRTAFYRKDDPAVQLSRRLQQGGPADPSAIDAAIAEDVNQSQYGRAVALAVRLLRDTSAWWRDPQTHPLPSVIQ